MSDCAGCGGPREDLSFARCKACRDKAATYQRDWTARRAAEGLCVRCNSPSVTAYYCERHAAEVNAYGARIQQARKERGECVDCAEPVASESVRCDRCRQRETERRIARVESRRRAGLCTNCGSRKGRRGNYCAACVARLREQRQQWVREGLCTKCGGERETERHRYCLACRELAARNQRESRRRRGIAPGTRPLGSRA